MNSQKITWGLKINSCLHKINAQTTQYIDFFTTLKRNRNASLFQRKMHCVVLYRDNEPSRFQVMLANSINRLFEMIINYSSTIMGFLRYKIYINPV